MAWGWRECYNPFHGCGFHDHEGKPVPTIPLMAGRAFVQKLYQIVKSRKPDGQIQLHPGSAWFAPVMSWASVAWDGETILGDNQSPTERKSAFLMDYLTLEMFRAQYMGHPWGVAGEFLHYYIPLPYDDVTALTLPHDIIIRPNSPREQELQGGDINPAAELHTASNLWLTAEKFGRREAKLLPYWENQDYVAVEGKNAIDSLYKHDTNGVLAVISNLDRNSQQVNVRFAFDKLGLPPSATATHAFTHEPINMQNGEIALNLKSLGWTMILISP